MSMDLTPIQSSLKLVCFVDFDPVLSDIHCAVTLIYSYKYNDNLSNSITNNGDKSREIVRKWVPSKREEFINNIDTNIVQQISVVLDDKNIDSKTRVSKAPDML